LRLQPTIEKLNKSSQSPIEKVTSHVTLAHNHRTHPKGRTMAERISGILRPGWLTPSRGNAIRLQLVFLALCIVTQVVQFFVTGDFVADYFALGGFVAIVVATVMAFFSWTTETFAVWTFIYLPALDFVGVTLIRMIHPHWQTGSLLLLFLLLPTLWLGSYPHSRGLYLTIPLALIAVGPDFVRLVAITGSDTLISIIQISFFPLLAVTLAFASDTFRGGYTFNKTSRQMIRSANELAVDSEIETSRMLATVLDSVDVGIVVFGPAGEPFIMNSWVRDLPAMTQSNGDPWKTFLSLRPLQNDRTTPIDTILDPIARAFQGEIITSETFWLSTDHEDPIALSLTTAPVKNGWKEGRAGILLVLTDVTVFLEAVEKRDSFVGAVSHELRTPLTTIIGYIELIMEERDTLPAVIGEHLTKIAENAERQLMLVNDLLEVSKARGLSFDLNFDEVDLRYLAKETVKIFANQIAAKKLKVSVSSGVTMCRVDPRRIGEVIENLVSNAVRYTPAGGSISIQTSAIPAAGNVPALVQLTVTDTGMGIPVDEQHHLFDEFFRATNARAAAIQGVGLGLYVVKRVVDAHHGTISIRSVVNKGTTVTVELPATPPVDHPPLPDQA
jgi:signal transduction histidine kinase